MLYARAIFSANDTLSFTQNQSSGPKSIIIQTIPHLKLMSDFSISMPKPPKKGDFTAIQPCVWASEEASAEKFAVDVPMKK